MSPTPASGMTVSRTASRQAPRRPPRRLASAAAAQLPRKPATIGPARTPNGVTPPITVPARISQAMTGG